MALGSVGILFSLGMRVITPFFLSVHKLRGTNDVAHLRIYILPLSFLFPFFFFFFFFFAKFPFPLPVFVVLFLFLEMHRLW